MPETDVTVGIAEIKVGRSPQRLAAYGLGSCVAVALYDGRAGIGGLAHIMLPSSRFRTGEVLPGKYADTALESLWEELRAAGADPGSVSAKIAGGANMFSSLFQQAVPIGMRNVAAAREKLAEMDIPVAAEHVGGTRGRTLFFSLEDGRVEIRRLSEPSEWI